ncbi:VPS10 domain-containing receptor SorCS1 isoform X2 [Mastacembelus armatus]|uniref:VPS10 domain-containing receptor SorCS1 isoform X2 n=1 Tax=Mastacembelus armatus TaxID=205130 RepID=UPI000E454E6B|nr:VPS10 domain-containing receptor SorCS1-like isoform X2 [Mastacembelus armatus]XP_026160036.1 VPS10 domain-containing receptor SorCS1-like isoform X2 [Mastacembelus armatus]
MEREVNFCPKWFSTLWVSLLMMLCLFHAAKAEITCRSCQPGNKWRAQLMLKFDTSKSATGLKGEVFGNGDGTERFGAASAESQQLHCAAGSRECASGRVGYSEARLKRNTDNLRAKGEFGDGEFAKNKVSHVKTSGQPKTSDGAGFIFTTQYRKRARRNTENKLRSLASAQNQDPGEGTSSASGRRLTRSELRWSGEERRAIGPRQEELKLNSSTFALTGDSSHNQAMVHWSGQNSSVILMLTKLFDFNLNSVTESSLWRSTDYGATYQKLNEKVGAKTILSYLYVSPNNKRKIMLLTDPEVESSLLISSDEGATYQKYRLNFYILSLLFHPEQEDWILAYSHDQKLYSSVEFGRRWQLVHERVAPNRFYWSKMGLDKEPGLIHLETSISEGQALYVTCKLQNCTDANKGKPFPGYIDPNSLVVQDEYVFVQVSTAGRPIYYVSAKRDVFTPMKLPKYTLPKAPQLLSAHYKVLLAQSEDLHVISTDENRVVAAVQEWNQNETYTLYVSDTSGVYYTLALENVVSSMGPEGNVMVDLYEVAGIKGMFLANKKTDNQVKTYITYNRGRDWRLLQAPSKDLRGNSIHCVLPYCSLHLHLHVSANPYTSGNIASRDSVPGIIIASGSIGSELTSSNVSVFITSDAGNTWRQIFDEEYAVLYLDQGGALVAIRHTPLPIRHLWLSFDEGQQWNKYSFTNTPLFVDGVLGEPGEETLIMTIFGHVSHRSEWQLVKIDFRSIFNKRCTEADYQTWHLHNQGEPCLMGVKRIYWKLKPTSRCVMGTMYSVSMTSGPCDCTEADFECDYGYERRSDGKCTPAFWFHPSSVSRSCTTGMTFLNSTGYRKVVSNNCTAGVSVEYTAKRQQCPIQAPKGLHLVTSEGMLTATLGTNVTFLVFLEEGDGARTSITLDFGDGHALTYSNVSSIEDGIKHIYKAVGIYRVTATGENSLGSETALLYLHVTCQLEYIHLSAPFVAVRNKELNLTAVLWPSQVGTVTYIWWIGNNTEPVITLEGSIACMFSREGINTVTVQVSAGNTILQDRKTIAVHEYFRSHLLAFSSNLDDHNPDVAEWRLDVSRVIKNALIQATGVREDQLLVTVLPGLPTTAEFFLLPDKQLTEGKPEKTSAHLDQLSEFLLSALNQNLVQFTLRPGVQVTVYAAHLSAAPLVDTSENHSGSAMLMLLSVVVVGLAVFVIYKFKRKIPGLNVYAQMQNEKEQEMMSPANPTEATPSSQQDLAHSLEILDTEFSSRPIEVNGPIHG